MKRISIVIVNYNGRHLLPGCLGSLEAQTRRADEVILVDNGSTDGSAQFVIEEYPWVRLIEAGENLGFAAGNNLGIRASGGEIVVLLNNDTIAGPGFIEQIAAPFDASDPPSAVAGVMLFSTDPRTVATTGIAVYDNGLALDRDVGRPWRDLGRQFEVFGPSAGAAAYLRAALDDAELFPEPYFLYLEDVDLAWRLRLRGHRTEARRDAWALHIYSASSEEGSALKDYYLARNRAWTLIRCWPDVLWRRNWWSVLRYEFAAVGYAMLTGRWSSVAGRFRGWTGYSRLRPVRARISRITTVNPKELLYWICPAPSYRSLLGMRRAIGELARLTGSGREC